MLISVVDELDTGDAPADDGDDVISGVDVGATSDDVEEEIHSDAILDDSALADDDDQTDDVPSTAAFVDSPRSPAGEVVAVESSVLGKRDESIDCPTDAAALGLPGA